MPEPVNDVMNEKIYIKIAMVIFTLVGIAGGCMSIAGVVVGLTLNPNQLTAANFKQVERFGLDAALYFDCGENNETCFTQLCYVSCFTAFCMSFFGPADVRGKHAGKDPPAC